MYNSLVLAALLPLSGPTAGERLASLPPPVRVGISASESAVDPGDRVPVLPQRTRVAYAPDGEAPIPAWGPASTVPQPAVPAPAPRTANTATPPTFAATANRPNVIELQGRLEIPTYNRVLLGAHFQAQLMSLKTAKRDAVGNVITGADGQPQMIPLREGMHVAEGQRLGHFDTRYLEAQRASAISRLRVAQAEAENVILLKAALTSINTEKAELAIFEESNRLHEGSVSQLEVNRSRLKVEHAIANYHLEDYKLNVIKKEELNVQHQEVEAADVMIQLRQIVAPIPGMIVKINKAEGEWLREGDPVLEIVQLDTLRVVCKVDANQYDSNSVTGKAVAVTTPLVNGKTEEFPGKVVFASPIIDSGDTFDVYIEVQNRPSGVSWLLQPGRMVTAAIKL